MSFMTFLFTSYSHPDDSTPPQSNAAYFDLEEINRLNLQMPDLELGHDENDTSLHNRSSDYLLPHDLKKREFFKLTNNFSVLHHNVRSLSKNFDLFQIFLSALNVEFSVIGLCETWLSETPSPLLTVDGYSFVPNNRESRPGGGVAFYIQNDLDFALRADLNFMTDAIESIFIEINVPQGRNIIVGEIYMPPNSNYTDFIETLQSMLTSPSFNDKHCMIMGDFNFNLFNYNDKPHCRDFLDIMTSKSPFPSITKPTRISDTVSTLIDNVFSNISHCMDQGIIVSDISDYFPVFTCTPHISNTFKPDIQNIKAGSRHMSEENTARLRASLILTDWSVVLNNNDSNDAFNKLVDIIMILCDIYIPVKSPSKSGYKKVPRSPWISKCILKSINRKNSLFYKYKSKRTDASKLKYSSYRNSLTSVIIISTRS